MHSAYTGSFVTNFEDPLRTPVDRTSFWSDIKLQCRTMRDKFIHIMGGPVLFGDVIPRVKCQEI